MRTAFIERNRYIRTQGTCQDKVKAEVSAGWAKDTETGWKQWIIFCYQMALDPLHKVFEDKIPYLQVLDQWVQEDEFPKDGNPVQARTAEDCIQIVAQTFLGMETLDLRYADNHRINFCIIQMFWPGRKRTLLPNVYKANLPPSHSSDCLHNLHIQLYINSVHGGHDYGCFSSISCVQVNTPTSQFPRSTYSILWTSSSSTAHVAST